MSLRTLAVILAIVVSPIALTGSAFAEPTKGKDRYFATSDTSCQQPATQDNLIAGDEPLNVTYHFSSGAAKEFFTIYDRRGNLVVAGPVEYICVDVHTTALGRTGLTGSDLPVGSLEIVVELEYENDEGEIWRSVSTVDKFNVGRR